MGPHLGHPAATYWRLNMSNLDQLGLKAKFHKAGEAQLADGVLNRLEAVAAFDLEDTLNAAVQEGELDANQTESAGNEFKRFLALTLLARHGVGDVEQRIAGPSPVVDAVWHECLDDEDGYKALCDDVLGFHLGHGVDLENTPEPESSQPMVDLLTEFFVTHDAAAWSGNLASCWPVIR